MVVKKHKNTKSGFEIWRDRRLKQGFNSLQIQKTAN